MPSRIAWSFCGTCGSLKNMLGGLPYGLPLHANTAPSHKQRYQSSASTGCPKKPTRRNAIAHNQIFPTGTAALPVHAMPRSAHAANMIPRNALMATSCPPRDSASSSPYAPTLSAPAASTRLTAMRDYTGKIVLSVENEYSGKMPERQLRLFEHPRPLLTRLGADFFKSVPPCPGV